MALTLSNHMIFRVLKLSKQATKSLSLNDEYQDRDSLRPRNFGDVETESLSLFGGYQDRDSMRPRNFGDVETETHLDQDIFWMSRLRLLETKIFCGCQDRDSKRPRNLTDVDTESSRDWAKGVENETLLRVLLISVL